MQPEPKISYDGFKGGWAEIRNSKSEIRDLGTALYPVPCILHPEPERVVGVSARLRAEVCLWANIV